MLMCSDNAWFPWSVVHLQAVVAGQQAECMVSHCVDIAKRPTLPGPCMAAMLKL
jgi:hypothetical protein